MQQAAPVILCSRRFIFAGVGLGGGMICFLPSTVSVKASAVTSRLDQNQEEKSRSAAEGMGGKEQQAVG